MEKKNMYILPMFPQFIFVRVFYSFRLRHLIFDVVMRSATTWDVATVRPEVGLRGLDWGSGRDIPVWNGMRARLARSKVGRIGVIRSGNLEVVIGEI